MAESTITEHEKQNLFQRQARAGEGNIANLTPEEQKKIAKVNIEKKFSSVAGIEQKGSMEISPRIRELLKRQTLAGTPGNPELTETERRELQEFHSRQVKKG